jgi:outer membrane receptor protein involved in Fe transport
MLPIKDIPAYFLWDVGANYTIGKLELGLNVHNVLNKQYTLGGACTGGIPQKGRWWMATVAYKF